MPSRYSDSYDPSFEEDNPLDYDPLHKPSEDVPEPTGKKHENHFPSAKEIDEMVKNGTIPF